MIKLQYHLNMLLLMDTKRLTLSTSSIQLIRFYQCLFRCVYLQFSEYIKIPPTTRKNEDAIYQFYALIAFLVRVLNQFLFVCTA